MLSSRFRDMQPYAHTLSTPARSRAAIIHRTRLVTGLVLFTYVSTHFLNHSCGLLGLDAMEAGRDVFLAIWRNPVGMTMLYGSLTIHFLLALWSIFQRRQFRMPLWEAAQLLLGLAIPLLLAAHAIGTHFANLRFGVIDSYTRVMLVYWSRPEAGMLQLLLLVVAWIHGCIGLHFWLRIKPWYPRAATTLLIAALLLPIFALLGFLEALREIADLAQSASWVQETRAAMNEASPGQRKILAGAVSAVLAGYAACLGLTLIARFSRNLYERSHNAIRVTYPDGRKIAAPIGHTLLEVSRFANIPHASVCGGRGRCSTCRVRVTSGLKNLPAASADELAVLKRVGAAEDVRLACQLRPTSDVSVTPLLAATATALDAFALADDLPGEEREICVLFADLRGFTRLSEHKLPYDVVFFLNRYFETMGNAIEQAGGIPNQFTGDGVMALFGVESGPQQGCLDALNAATAMMRGIAQMDAELGGELHEPLRIGIGIHTGPAVVGRMGRGIAKYLTAVGDTVHVASRLQDLTKQYQCRLIVSEPAAQAARLDISGIARHEITVRNRAEPIAIFIMENMESLAAHDVPPGV